MTPIERIVAEHGRVLALYIESPDCSLYGEMKGLEYAASILDYKAADALIRGSGDALAARINKVLRGAA